jgi:hypothetical protein
MKSHAPRTRATVPTAELIVIKRYTTGYNTFSEVSSYVADVQNLSDAGSHAKAR